MGSARSRPIAAQSSYGKWQVVRPPREQPWQIVADDAYESSSEPTTPSPSHDETPWQIVQDPRVVPAQQTWVEPQPRLSMARGQQGRPVVDPQLPWWQRRRQWEAFQQRRAAARQHADRDAAMRRIRRLVGPRQRQPESPGVWAATAGRVADWLG